MNDYNTKQILEALGELREKIKGTEGLTSKVKTISEQLGQINRELEYQDILYDMIHANLLNSTNRLNSIADKFAEDLRLKKRGK